MLLLSFNNRMGDTKMLHRSIIVQTKYLLKQKGALFTFYAFLILVLINYFHNISNFTGYEVIDMYHPMKLLSLSYNRVNYNADTTLILIQLYPILVVCPAGFSLIKESQTGHEVMMASRMGYHNYHLSKLLSAFFTTAIICSAPFFIEIILNCIAFPLNATGDLSNWGLYEADYVQSVQNYLFPKFFIQSPYLYAIAGTLFWGIYSGLLGAFTVAFSSVFKIKYKILLFLPVYLLLNATLYIPRLLPRNTMSVKWYDYLLLFNDQAKSYWILIIKFLLLTFFITISFLLSNRREHL